MQIENVLTIVDIKNSVEYFWRKRQIIWLFAAFGITICAAIIYCIFQAMLTGDFLIVLIVFFASIFTIALILVPFVIYFFVKLRYLTKNYFKLPLFEVELQDIHTSFSYRGAVYFSVHIKTDEISRKVDTNPLFSSWSWTGKLELERYNGKKVRALFDEKLDKLFVIDLL